MEIIGAQAQVGPDALLGAGVRVDASAVIQRAVAWDGTHLAPSERVVDQLAAPGIRLDV